MTVKDKKWLTIGGGVAAVVALYFIFKSKTDNKGGANDPTQGNGPIDPAKIALKLYDAMKESGTDEDYIVQTLKNVNAAQFIEVMNKFGKRSYNATLGNQYNFNPFSDLPLRDLPFWLKNELSAERYNVLSAKYSQL